MPETIGEHVRERRRALGISQAQAARRIGLCRDALVRWEMNRTIPDVRMMPKVIEFLGYDPQPPATTFRELLLRTRRSLGLNQPEIAALLSVPESTFHDWERGRSEPGAKRKALVEERIGGVIASGSIAAGIRSNN